MSAELNQVHDRGIVTPVHKHSLTKEEKRCGKKKAPGCADGCKQRIYKTKNNTSSLMVSTEALLISCTIDAEEQRDIATCDVPGAFMQANIDEKVHVSMRDEFAELFIKLKPDLYSQFVTMENGKPDIYLQLNKVLYGTLQVALMFWRNLSNTLKEWGIVTNPYDQCVANKLFNGHQCTLLWHVNDMKISHVNKSVVSSVICDLNKKYGTITPLSVNRGKIHDYLGMTIDFSKNKKCVIHMDDYIDETISEAPGDMGGVASTPATEFLFRVNSNAERLDKKKADLFHSITT